MQDIGADSNYTESEGTSQNQTGNSQQLNQMQMTGSDYNEGLSKT